MIILIGGKAGCGKDTVGSIIENTIFCHREAFATELKELACNFGWNGVKDFRGRKLLQRLGFAGREYNPNVWINPVVRRINTALFLDRRIHVAIITDFRFPNEYKKIVEYFPDHEVKTIKVVGRKKDLGKNSKDTSENALNDFIFDATIVNSGTLQELENEVKTLLKEWDII